MQIADLKRHCRRRRSEPNSGQNSSIAPTGVQANSSRASSWPKRAKSDKRAQSDRRNGPRKQQTSEEHRRKGPLLRGPDRGRNKSHLNTRYVRGCLSAAGPSDESDETAKAPAPIVHHGEQAADVTSGATF